MHRVAKLLPAALLLGASLPPADPVSAAILAEHNRARAEVGAPPLHWDRQLARAADAYAQTLTKIGRLVHAPRAGRANQRENLLMGVRGLHSPRQMVRVWIDEKRHFRPGLFPNVSRTGNWADVAHYTQVVWRQTSRLGCAIRSDRRFDYLVCRYSPPGNIDGHRLP